MKKGQDPSKDEMRPEYSREDLGDGVRGKYHEACSKAAMESKEIDAVGMVRRIRDTLYEETKSLSTEELIQFYRSRAAATRERLSRLHMEQGKLARGRQ